MASLATSLAAGEGARAVKGAARKFKGLSKGQQEGIEGGVTAGLLSLGKAIWIPFSIITMIIHLVIITIIFSILYWIRQGQGYTDSNWIESVMSVALVSAIVYGVVNIMSNGVAFLMMGPIYILSIVLGTIVDAIQPNFLKEKGLNRVSTYRALLTGFIIAFTLGMILSTVIGLALTYAGYKISTTGLDWGADLLSEI